MLLRPKQTILLNQVHIAFIYKIFIFYLKNVNITTLIIEIVEEEEDILLIEEIETEKEKEEIMKEELDLELNYYLEVHLVVKM